MDKKSLFPALTAACMCASTRQDDARGELNPANERHVTTPETSGLCPDVAEAASEPAAVRAA